MPNFKQRRELATDSQFLIKVRVAIVKSATAVVGEAPANPANTTKDDKRHALGEKVLAGPASLLPLFAEACAALGTLTTTSTDADVEFTVNSIWDGLAGVTGAEA